MPPVNEIHIYTDGGSRGNPGNSAIAFMIFTKNGDLILEHKECVGHGTNNEAEYKAVISALEAAKKHSAGDAIVHSDSKLVVNDMKGKFKIKRPNLRPLSKTLKEAGSAFRSVTYKLEKRENPRMVAVDRLVNKSMDECYGRKS